MTHCTAIFLAIAATGCTASVFQLTEMVGERTRRGSVAYAGYGCWCGAGSAGTSVTLDCTDSCCEVHDDCYTALAANGCNPYWTAYKFALDPLTCLDAAGACERSACECDRSAAICFSTWESTYREEFVSVRHSLCLQVNRYLDKPICTRLDGDSAGGRLGVSGLAPLTLAPSVSEVPDVTKRPLDYLPSVMVVFNKITTSLRPTGDTHGHAFAGPRVAHEASRGLMGKARTSSFEGDSHDPAIVTVRDLAEPLPVFTLKEMVLYLLAITVLYFLGGLLCFLLGVSVGFRQRAHPTTVCACTAPPQKAHLCYVTPVRLNREEML